MPYKTINPVYCRRAQTALASAFSWSLSPEGGAFWNAVGERLRSLGDGNNFDYPLWGGTAPPTALAPDQAKKYIAMLEQKIVSLDEEIKSQARTIVDLRRKLLVADFVNMGR